MPTELAPFRASEAARLETRRELERLGFRVFEDALGIVLSIDGPSALFSHVFAAPEEAIAKATISGAVPLVVPVELRSFVEDVELLPPPRHFA